MNDTLARDSGTPYKPSKSDFGDFVGLPPLFQTSCLDTVKVSRAQADRNRPQDLMESGTGRSPSLKTLIQKLRNQPQD